MEKTINKVRTWCAIHPFLIVMLIYLLLQLIVNKQVAYDGDVAIYFGKFSKEIFESHHIVQSFIQYLGFRYTQWTSRVIIETLLIICAYIPLFIFKILNSLVFTGIVYFSYKIVSFFTNKNSLPTLIFIALLTFLYPLGDMGSAGWIATLTNYPWPYLGLLISTYELLSLLKSKRNDWYRYFLILLSGVVSANQEQCVAIMLGMSVFLIIHFLIKKERFHIWPYIVYASITLLGFLNTILCPGNALRMKVELAHYFPEFANFSLIHKIELGSSRLLVKFVLQPNFILSVFTILLLIYVFSVSQQLKLRVVSVIPCFVSLTFGLFSNATYAQFPFLKFISNSLTQYGLFSFTSFESWIVWALLIIVIGCVLFVMISLSKQTHYDSLIIVCLLLLAFGSGAMLGLSPTIWASAERTLFFSYYLIIICCGFLFSKIIEYDFSNEKVVQSSL